MDSKVQVTADKAGNVIVKSPNNPTYGHIRVEQTRMVIDENGFARRKKLSALIPGTIKDLSGFGWEAGNLVAGKVIVKESMTPFNKKDPERDYKVAGQSGVVCCSEGNPIFRKHFFVLNPNAEDVTIPHDNEEEIKAAYAELAEEEATQTKDEFSL